MDFEPLLYSMYMFGKYNENATYQNMWDAAKGELRGKFVALNAYISKDSRSQVNI